MQQKKSGRKTPRISPAKNTGVLTDLDIHLFREGNHSRLYDKMGAQLTERDGREGVAFAVWAPEAKSVSVIGDFNSWEPGANRLDARWDGSGIWEGFIPGVEAGARYKYHIASHHRGFKVAKADPFAFTAELPPNTASRVWNLSYKWGDKAWMTKRRARNALNAPISVYEVHPGSWRRKAGNAHLTYRELAHELTDYVLDMGYTHVEIMPVMEHPFYGSWGYQVTGFFAPTARYGIPQDFMYFVDHLHRHGIGVILDWVPSHFPGDEHGLVYFDGTHLYEHSNPKEGYHPDWSSYIFNYGRHEVQSFLISSAVFWLDRYHADGIRVDAVASMLYRDYSRKGGEWIPNRYGGRENLEAIAFLKRLNESVYADFPDVQTIAEESTAWPMVSRPLYLGGLGFGMKWNMGWMNDTLKYFSTDPLFRKYQHDKLTFSLWYAFSENFVLSISHDEVVHGKGSLLGKMPGDEWQHFANLRLFFGYMFGHPGKKLHFMGSELGVWREWNHETELEWDVLNYPLHAGMQRWVKDLNAFYRTQRPLFEQDFTNEGFEWIDCHDWEGSTVSFIRKPKGEGTIILVVCNFTPVLRERYRIGVPRGGTWKEVLNSDAVAYGGGGQGNFGGIEAEAAEAHGRAHALTITLPPLSTLFFSSEAPEKPGTSGSTG
jgi:1,4-alpha-glucan branching enzyme